jgi:hypothetical protein
VANRVGAAAGAVPSVAAVSAEPLARLYDLALRALDEQERRADALRARLGPVLAAAALGASLLSGPVVGGEPPSSVAGILALVVAVGGLAVALVATRSLLTHRAAPLEEDVSRLTVELGQDSALDDATQFYEAMIGRLARHARRTTRSLDGSERTFTAVLCGILVMLCGLALAALVG